MECNNTSTLYKMLNCTGDNIPVILYYIKETQKAKTTSDFKKLALGALQLSENDRIDAHRIIINALKQHNKIHKPSITDRIKMALTSSISYTR